MLILASKSPTRAAILRSRGVKFTQKSADFDEDLVTERDPYKFVEIAARGKLDRAIALFGADKIIIAADTIVSVGGEILRKASDEADARAKLLLQSGSRVAIVTCSILRDPAETIADLSETIYDFAAFDEGDLSAYLSSGDWRGKAGAIMVETFGKKYIRSQTGFESCAMGITIEKLLPRLNLLGCLS
ncbi:MAG: septum formation inhibitor Maf [Helicobacteraceae bacterium]|jgi:septum formation protein|nr:septum formation inhibitor Maf [Helicobacteraceae bacterium]